MRSVPFHSTLSRHGKTRARSVLRMACRKRCILLFTLQQDANARFNIIKYKYVKEIHFCLILLAKKFVLSMIIRTFASSVPTKPLNDAQMRGAFLYI